MLSKEQIIIHENMKMNTKSSLCLSAVLAALVSGCEVTVAPEPVVVATPAPVVEVAPVAYVWDGYEFVGEYNGGFLYLNGGGVWVTCDAVVLGRFHGWERYHPDWRRTAIHYDRVHRPDPRNMRREPVRPGERRKEER
jgi:hypothetical protein